MTRLLLLFALFAIAHPVSRGSTINVHPGDLFTKIQNALPGDEVLIWPGTYRFRVHLTKQGTATAPIIIRAQDPANRPVWDMGASVMENAPGSQTSGDRGRGAWQFSGAAHYRISGIVFRNCRNLDANGAGIRYYNGTTGLRITDCLFTANDNGLTGGDGFSEAAVEFSEFSQNGNAAASAPTHNLYIYGGAFHLRYCYVHDSTQAQNFHIRAQTAVLEYNWFARAASYEGDLMTSNDATASPPTRQTMLVRGNVFIQKNVPGNRGQVLTLFNDTGVANLQLSIQVIGNTYVGNNTAGGGAAAAFVHLSNADSTVMDAEISNNIIFGTTTPTLVQNSALATIAGTNNWVASGVSAPALSNTVQSALPGFNNAGAKDYTLAAGSAALNRAAPLSASMVGIKEYWRNETTTRQYRTRHAARDIGAFERTTAGAGVGAYDPVPAPALLIARTESGMLLSWPATARDFRLEQARTLAAPWAAIQPPYAATPAGYQSPIPAGTTPGFYRLRHP